MANAGMPANTIYARIMDKAVERAAPARQQGQGPVPGATVISFGPNANLPMSIVTGSAA